MKAQGLTVKDGRLINDRPVGESGIAEAARLRRQMKNRYKAECIVESFFCVVFFPLVSFLCRFCVVFKIVSH